MLPDETITRQAGHLFALPDHYLLPLDELKLACIIHQEHKAQIQVIKSRRCASDLFLSKANVKRHPP
jgi:hypothetical protein